jgi:hypothetical protein
MRVFKRLDEDLMGSRRRVTGVFVAALLGIVLVCNSRALAAAPLLDITPAAVSALSADRAACDIIQRDGAEWLQLRPTSDAAGTVTIVPPTDHWDLSAAAGIEVRLRNPGQSAVTVRLLAANPDAKGLSDTSRTAIELVPGEERSMLLRLNRRPVDPTYGPFQQFYMYYKAINVRDNTLDPANVSKLTLSVTGGSVQASGFVPSGKGGPAPVPFLPFIDTYGQYIHGDWPGKIYSDTDFAQRRGEEEREQAGWPGPPNRDKYGGWTGGPTLKATGFFYPAKYANKWWFVDPDGRLFWSYGVTGVGFGGDLTPITNRTDWFASLPARDGPFGQFYQTGHGATYQYYQDRDWLGLDIQRVNLLRKYGADYEHQVAEVSHTRLHSWGFNTIGNWSDPQVYNLRQTPYTVPIHYGSAMIHPHMPDVYDPGWEPAVRARMEQERQTTANDPWNLGYFVDNERWFGWRPRAECVGEETMKNPPHRSAKIKFVDLLKNRYKSIDAFNAAWGLHCVSWDALLTLQQEPDMDNSKVAQDCGDFGMIFAERYFTVCRSAVKAVAPNNLYLGSRFFGNTDPVFVRMATKYCDVVSYNIYDNPPDGRVNQYSKIDAPILSSEWGIESDPIQTPFRDEKLTAPTPAERAAILSRYVEHALHLPNLVGAHFFQFRDQPISGRPDGEATLRGFVNVADTPNFELVQANRKVSYSMYETRMGMQ